MSRKELTYLCSIQSNHLDNIEPLELDEHGYKYILVLIDAFSRLDWQPPRWNQQREFSLLRSDKHS